MDKQELLCALDDMRLAKHYMDLAIERLSELLNTPTPEETSLRLAQLEGWAEMEKYMRGRKQ